MNSGIPTNSVTFLSQTSNTTVPEVMGVFVRCGIHHKRGNEYLLENGSHLGVHAHGWNIPLFEKDMDGFLSGLEVAGARAVVIGVNHKLVYDLAARIHQLGLKKVVILTSYRPENHQGTDADANIIAAITAAQYFSTPGVYIHRLLVLHPWYDMQDCPQALRAELWLTSRWDTGVDDHVPF